MNELTIKIRDIGEDQPRRMALPLDREFLEDALADLSADVAVSHGAVDAEVHRTGDNVFVRGRLAGEIVLPCGRCLREARVAVDLPLHVVVGPEELGGEDSLDEEIEYFTHDGQTVKLGEFLREALILTVPMAPLCRADCKGLCPVCGTDRNERACGCDTCVVDPRLTPLKDLKI